MVSTKINGRVDLGCPHKKDMTILFILIIEDPDEKAEAKRRRFRGKGYKKKERKKEKKRKDLDSSQSGGSAQVLLTRSEGKKIRIWERTSKKRKRGWGSGHIHWMKERFHMQLKPGGRKKNDWWSKETVCVGEENDECVACKWEKVEKWTVSDRRILVVQSRSVEVYF